MLGTLDFTSSEPGLPSIFLRVQPWIKLFYLSHGMKMITVHELTNFSLFLILKMYEDLMGAGGGGERQSLI